MKREKLIKEGYKLIETGYLDDIHELDNIEEYCSQKYNHYKIVHGKAEFPTITKYEIYIKNIKIIKNTQKKYKVKWYDNGAKEGIWKSESVYELRKKLKELNIFPQLFIEVE